MGQITSRGCARNYWITLDFVSCDPMFLAQPLDVIRPIRSSYLSNNVYVSFLDLCRLSYFEVKTSLNKPFSFFLSIFTGSLIHEHYTRECEFGNFDKIKNKKDKKKTKTQKLLVEFLFK